MYPLHNTLSISVLLELNCLWLPHGLLWNDKENGNHHHSVKLWRVWEWGTGKSGDQIFLLPRLKAHPCYLAKIILHFLHSSCIHPCSSSSLPLKAYVPHVQSSCPHWGRVLNIARSHLPSYDCLYLFQAHFVIEILLLSAACK